MKVACIFLIGVSSIFAAFGAVEMTFFVKERGEVNAYSVVRDGDALVSASCAGKKDAQFCNALKLLNAAPIRALSTDPEGFVVAPLAAQCREQGGAPVILSDANRNQLEFCRFRDGTVCSGPRKSR